MAVKMYLKYVPWQAKVERLGEGSHCEIIQQRQPLVPPKLVMNVHVKRSTQCSVRLLIQIQPTVIE